MAEGRVCLLAALSRLATVWLAWLVIGVRTVTLFPNFIGGAVSVNYREITSLLRIPFLGEVASVPVGVPNPWMVLAQFSLLLLLAYVADAAVSCWRLGTRQAIQECNPGGNHRVIENVTRGRF